jgi:hypothetical protein
MTNDASPAVTWRENTHNPQARWIAEYLLACRKSTPVASWPRGRDRGCGHNLRIRVGYSGVGVPAGGVAHQWL